MEDDTPKDVNQQPMQPMQPMPPMPDGMGAPHKKGSMKMMTVVVIVLLLVAAGVGYKLMHKTKKPATATTKTTTASIPSASLDIDPAQVTISATQFVPATITVKTGQAVVWKNTDSAPHLVASDPYPTNSTLPDLNSHQQIDAGGSYSYVFAKAGTYTYHDNLHPTILGTVIVR